MTLHETWSLDPKLLDAFVRNLREVVSSESLRKYEAVLLPGGLMDVHASQFARAYRIKEINGSFACLRFWLDTAQTPILEIYSALERAPEVRTRCGLSQVQLFTEAIEVDGRAIPAVLMDWVEGIALGDALNAHVGNFRALCRIAEALLSTFVSLNDLRISHGDLRASNILAAVDNNFVRVGLVDLDSLRWHGGTDLPRVIGGNPLWNNIRQRDGVALLESDYLDQAVTFLTVVAVAAERSWWPGSTDGFFRLEHLRADLKEVLRRLERMGGTPARVAGAVRRAIEEPGHWAEVANAMRNSTGEPLAKTVFWDKANERRGSLNQRVREAPQPPVPEPEQMEVPQLVNNAPSPPANRRPWLWILVAFTMAVIVVMVIYWLKQP